jgi:general secretion pathway protein G
MNVHFRHSGFTLIEMVVALAIVGVLAAILTPLVLKYVDDARVTRAAQEAQTIATAVLNFNKDTGKWPIFTNGVGISSTSASYQVLSGPGIYPSCAMGITCTVATWAATGSLSDTISDQLEFNKPGGNAAFAYTTAGKFAWRGAYLTNTGSDPWGYAYVINAGNLAYGASNAAFVLSAGPNNVIDTSFAQSIGSGSSAIVVGGDDIIARIK